MLLSHPFTVYRNSLPHFHLTKSIHFISFIYQEEEERKKQEADAILWGDQGPPINDNNAEPKLTDGMAALSDSQFFRMMGITSNDIDKLPGWVKGIVGR